MNKKPNYKLLRYLAYVLLLIASILTIIGITRFNEIDMNPVVMISQVVGFYFLGFYFLWKSEENPNKK
jgi:hypothetical protein